MWTTLGAIYAVFAAKGLGANLTGWLMIHGTTEMFAICTRWRNRFEVGRYSRIVPGITRVARV